MGVVKMTPPKGLGYRQRAILAILADAPQPLATGYIRRQALGGCDPRTCHMALKGLRARGLIEHVSHGRWAAA